nr:ribonuclease H-like domain-containing protein [Tanacetum cinerariifolium]
MGHGLGHGSAHDSAYGSVPVHDDENDSPVEEVSPVKPKKPSRRATKATKDEPNEAPKEWTVEEEIALCQGRKKSKTSETTPGSASGGLNLNEESDEAVKETQEFRPMGHDRAKAKKKAVGASRVTVHRRTIHQRFMFIEKKIILMASQDQQWYMDTGATSHLSSHTVRKFTIDNKCSIDFDPYGFTVRDYHTRQTLLRCDSTGDLYPLHVAASAFALLTNNHSLWHQRLGHPGDTVIQTLSSRGLVSYNKKPSTLVSCLPVRKNKENFPSNDLPLLLHLPLTLFTQTFGYLMPLA